MSAVLDASAVLAFLLGEPGAERVADAIADAAIMSTLNFAEVAGCFARTGATLEYVEAVQLRLSVRLIKLDDYLALEAGMALAVTKPYGLSLGDRVCLMTARRWKLPALTADRDWLLVADALGVQVELIR